MKYRSICALVLCAELLAGNLRTPAQTNSDYDALVRQGNSQLQAGSNDLALTTANSAIKLNADRWEAYAVAGGALMNLKRYEEAADDFSHAIDHAPEAKQTGLRDLRKQSLLAEAGATPSSAPQPAPPAAQPATTTQAEIVLWKSIEGSTNPEDFKTYLQQYPSGAFATLAQRHLAEAQANAERERKLFGVPLPGTVWVGTSSTVDKHQTYPEPVLIFFLDSGQIAMHHPNKVEASGIATDATHPIDELRGKYLPHNWTTGSGSWTSTGNQVTVHFLIVNGGTWQYTYSATRTDDLMEGTWICTNCKDQGPLQLHRIDSTDAVIAEKTVHDAWAGIFW